MEEKRGKFGRPHSFCKVLSRKYNALPDRVKYHINRLQDPNLDEDWVQFKAEDNNMWMVARTWDTETLYTISACIIAWEDFYDLT